ncbi:nSTAND3 domain-containing NTPase [Mucilaginibacter psychrotolerans]|uniref:Novel STAND NTPase 3 domain-containing protein n=1 Tax=Mucilaginibacter psychrotolerans TaxID=1524096 RepID=A0A4Y8SAZ3_9SPHI|nr:hypothetical protein [Mucilaginibacter psychrotolerans]TFF36189.1 hypothetical protein E2R66_16745 [Mucilaginibacter psychrotolerans]
MNIIDFQLHKLGWSSFQSLCHSICKEVFKQPIERYLDSKDGGRDGAFTGIWKEPSGKEIRGRYVIQSKFTSKVNEKLTVADLKDEYEKVKRLAKDGRCDFYLIMTNAEISGIAAEDIEDYFKAAGAKEVICHGSNWINEQLTENKRLRMLVPRVYGLGDLSEIFDERAFKQAESLLASMKDDLAKVVLTDAYYRAADAIDQEGFVLLIGEPAAGKTTIASMLAVGAIDQWKAHTIKVAKPDLLLKHWNPDGEARLFWIDDAFGAMQYESGLVQSWNSILSEVKAMVKSGVKIVMTSRDYIYDRARNDLKESAFPLFKESRVVIDVHNLSLKEKQQILYNHLKLGKQQPEFITEIKPHLDLIANHERFIPETARRLSDPAFTKDLILHPITIENFVIGQEQFLIDTLVGLDVDSKAALALVYMSNGRLASPISLNESEKEIIERIGSNTAQCLIALQSMAGSFVQHITSEDDADWQFKHPTVGDAFAKVIAKTPELLGVYVQGSSLSKMMSQVTMGDLKVEKALIIPKVVYPIVLERLKMYETDDSYKEDWTRKYYGKRNLFNFLARRCSKEFLKQFFTVRRDLLNEVSMPGLYLSISPHIALAIRLHSFGLLPEEIRLELLQRVMKYAVAGEDVYIFENKQFQGMFTDDELSEIKNRVELGLLPKLELMRERLQEEFNENGDDTPDEYTDKFSSLLSTLKDEFEREPAFLQIIKNQDTELENWRNNQEYYPASTPGRFSAKPSFAKPGSDRSIFDDINE